MAKRYTAFFYGTLMHPKILESVIGHPGNELQTCPALALDHTRHQIKGEDCPAMLPYKKSHKLFAKELKARDRTVRGMLVRGLTDADMALLNQYEGNEYKLEKILVYMLGAFKPLSASSDADISLDPPPLPQLDTLPPPAEAHTYIWAGRLRDIRPDLWEYTDFVRDNARKWINDATP
ncbi:hypothetical protein OBBRIDRAFT_797538 [Obba rivulosa]|uniref:Putative gamma-glutamylcyclotransferase n=1 Tax=Obba rivulosa TaxID=1052685 RepID=A0A8E2AST1_9APHY|nr:hypothetical protein OBBRIDRAFT_797538 [Obba rivulosa]